MSNNYETIGKLAELRCRVKQLADELEELTPQYVLEGKGSFEDRDLWAKPNNSIDKVTDHLFDLENFLAGACDRESVAV